jgi:hypothetical protein
MALGNRKAAEAFVYKAVEALLPGGGNAELYQAYFAKMTDAEFDDWIGMLERNEAQLRLIAPNLTKVTLDFKRNLAVADKYNVKLYQRAWLTDPKTGDTTLTPKKYLTVHLPIRRQQQLLTKKISIADDNLHIDELTGQPTGVSKGATLSFPEMQLLYAKGLTNTTLEFIKLRGGDAKAFNEMNRQIVQTGTANVAEILRMNTRVTSTVSLSIILTGMHLSNNL